MIRFSTQSFLTSEEAFPSLMRWSCYFPAENLRYVPTELGKVKWLSVTVTIQAAQKRHHLPGALLLQMGHMESARHETDRGSADQREKWKGETWKQFFQITIQFVQYLTVSVPQFCLLCLLLFLNARAKLVWGDGCAACSCRLESQDCKQQLENVSSVPSKTSKTKPKNNPTVIILISLLLSDSWFLDAAYS